MAYAKMLKPKKPVESRPRGRPKLFGTHILLGLVDGTLDRIDAVRDRDVGETRLEFIRTAIARELKRRQR